MMCSNVSNPHNRTIVFSPPKKEYGHSSSPRNTTHKKKTKANKEDITAVRDAIDENETRERTEVRVFIATALPTKAVCWTVVAANIFVYICVCFYCALLLLRRDISRTRLREKNYPKRRRRRFRGEANEKKEKKCRLPRGGP